MKYSIRGNLSIDDSSDIIILINKYTLWRLVTGQIIDMDGKDFFNFEAWLNNETDKNDLFNKMKLFVNQHGGLIDWHVCSHDEEISTPCIITEEYRGD